MSTIKHSLQETFEYYTVFEDNQVLTSTQLNEVVEYLDDQNKLTRVNLLGVGIVCGLIPTFTDLAIKISKGCAVTTDGDLLRFNQEMEFTKFKIFTDSNADYDHFKVNGTRITLRELHTDTSKVRNLTDIKELPANLKRNGLILLYNENHLHDPDICTGCDCDNVGRIRFNNLKALLVLESDYKKIVKSVPSISDCISSLRSIKTKRVILNDKTIRTLKQLYDVYATNIDLSVKDIIKSLGNLSASCSTILSKLWVDALPFDRWNEIISSAYTSVKNKRTDFQYFYNFLKDFIRGLNEFIEELSNVNYFCNIDYDLFPKHVCLGSYRNLASLTYDTHRTGFYASPVIKDDNFKKLQFLFMRLHRMVINLNITYSAASITILPEQACCSKLGDKVIPAYIKYDSANTVHDFWNYTLCNQSRSKEQLSFFSKSYSDNDAAIDPLSYEHENCRLYRIAGHVGWDVEKAETEINSQIKKYNLPFMVMSLQVENILTTIPLKPSRKFRDVRILHKAYRQDLNRNLTNLSVFNEKLVKRVKDAEEKPPVTSKDPKNRFKDYSVDKITNLGEKVQQLKTNLTKKTTDFSYATFAKDYKAAVTNASSINKTIRGVTFTDTSTPYDLMINQSKLNTLKWLDDIIVKEVEKTKELATLQKFLEENPGMEHYAGVPFGGTFILVYTSNDKKVIADFALPYWYCDCGKDEEIEETVEEEDDPIKWPDFNDVIIDFDRSFGIADKLKIVEDDFTIEKGKILNLSTNVISKDEIDTKIDRKLTDRDTIINGRIDQKLSEKETSITNLFNSRLTDKETSITNLFNAKLSEKEASLNAKLSEKEISMRSDFDTRLSSKESSITASVNDKIGQINTRFTENQEIFSIYAENFGTLINTTSSSIQKIGSIDKSSIALSDKLNIADSKLLNIAETMDAAAKLVDTGNLKKGAGKLSSAEEKNLTIIESTAANSIIEAIDAIAASGADIVKGSDEERLLSLAIANADKLSETSKAAVVKKAAAVKSASADKRGLSDMLSKIK